MAGDWTSKFLGEICEFRGGQGFPLKYQGLAIGDYPFIKVSDMELPGNRHRITRANHWIDEAARKELRAKPHPPTSTVFAKIGVALTYNRRRLLSRPTIVDNNMMAAVPIESKVDPLFLYYLLKVTDFNEVVAGTALPYINGSDLAKMVVTLPSLPTQRAIASVLGTLDDLIELNRETNEILEEMARALFKSWFVDFDPVRAKLEGRPPAGMDAATAALFPDHFQDSELGQIPKGWEVVTLGSVLNVLETGRRPKGGVAGYSFGVPSVGAESINGIGVFDFSKTKFIPHEFYERTTSGRIQNLDVLLYKDGGKPGEFRPRVGLYGYGFPFDEFCINEHVFRMRADPVGQHYLYFAISDDRVLLDFANKGGKAAIPGINQTDVRSTQILLPPQEILKEFERLARPICQSIIENFAESRDLAILRDTLLPKLLSGEVKAPTLSS